MGSCCSEYTIASVSVETRPPRFEVADGKDLVGTSSVDVASVGAPRGSYIPAVSASSSVYYVGPTFDWTGGRRTAGPQEWVTPRPRSQLSRVGGY